MSITAQNQITLINLTETYSIILTNESQQFATDSSRVPLNSVSYYTDIIVYQGSTERTDYTIGTVSSANNIIVSQTSNRITFSVTSSNAISADSGTFTIPITIDGQTFNKIFSWSCSKQGTTGTSAKSVDITASSQVFKSTDGGTTFTPDTITLTPIFQGGISYSKWQYSVDGGSTWSDISSGSNGLIISNGILTIAKTSDLYTDTVTSISFKCISNSSTYYDIVTVLKLYDVDVTEIMSEITNIKSTVSGVSSQVDANTKSISDKIWQTDITETVNNYDGTTVKLIRDRVTETETSINGITSTVSDISSGLTDVTNRVTIVEQTSEKIGWLIKSGTSSTEFTLTDKLATLIAETISLNGNVKVNGDMLVDGCVSADKIDVTDLFAQDITATGTITGVNLIGATGSFSGNLYTTEGTLGGWSIKQKCLYTDISVNSETTKTVVLQNLAKYVFSPKRTTVTNGDLTYSGNTIYVTPKTSGKVYLNVYIPISQIGEYKFEVESGYVISGKTDDSIEGMYSYSSGDEVYEVVMVIGKGSILEEPNTTYRFYLDLDRTVSSFRITYTMQSAVQGKTYAFNFRATYEGEDYLPEEESVISGIPTNAILAVKDTTNDVVQLPFYILYDGTVYSQGSLYENGTLLSNRYLSLDGGTLNGALTVNGLIKSTNNGNTVTIGSQNSGYCHFANSEDIPFHFNKQIETNKFKIYNSETYLENGNLTIGDTKYYDGYIELSGGTPFIDFHFGDSTADYTSRIIEEASGTLNLNGVTIGNKRVNAANWFCSSGASGWYNATYAGGWYMTDTSWLRSYNSKSIYIGTGKYATSNHAGTYLDALQGKAALQVDSAGASSGFNALGTVRAFSGAYSIGVLNQDNTFRILYGTEAIVTGTTNTTSKVWTFDVNGGFTCSGNINAGTVTTYSGNYKPVGSYATDGKRVNCLAALDNSEVKIWGQWDVAGAGYSSKVIKVTTSDIRLKTNIMDTEIHALDTINRIQMRQFDWISNARHQDIGFIADELELLDSGFAFGGGYNEDGTMDAKGVDDFYVLGYAIKGIQEICAIDDAQNDRLNLVESRQMIQDARIEFLENELSKAKEKINELMNK